MACPDGLGLVASGGSRAELDTVTIIMTGKGQLTPVLVAGYRVVSGVDPRASSRRDQTWRPRCCSFRRCWSAPCCWSRRAIVPDAASLRLPVPRRLRHGQQSGQQNVHHPGEVVDATVGRRQHGADPGEGREPIGVDVGDGLLTLVGLARRV